VYNEEGNVARLLTSLGGVSRSLGRQYRIFICNDGSTDKTREIIETHQETLNGNVLLLNQQRNHGVARAFERIFNETLGLDEPWSEGILVTMEGDNTSDLRILPEILAKIEEESCNVSLASCYARGGRILNTDSHRVFLSRCANLFVRMAFAYFGIWHVHTFSSFYRACQIPFLRTVHSHYGPAFVSSTGFECMVETLARFAARGARIGEVPMVLDGSLRTGATKLRIRKTTLGYFRLLVNLYAPRVVVARILGKR
jgi:dolichol-phosphate mannosyltransferase